MKTAYLAMRFERRLVAMTGGGSGFGKEVAARFVVEAADVVINGRDAGKLEAAACELDPSGLNVAGISYHTITV